MTVIDFEKVKNEISEILQNNGIASETFAVNIHLSANDFDHVVAASLQAIEGYQPPIRRAFVRHGTAVFHMLGGPGELRKD